MTRWPSFVTKDLALCHAGLERTNGRWFIDVDIQHWPVARVEISDREAWRIMERYNRIELGLNEAIGNSNKPTQAAPIVHSFESDGKTCIGAGCGRQVVEGGAVFCNTCSSVYEKAWLAFIAWKEAGRAS